MKKIILLLMLLASAGLARADDVPAPTGRVNDFANLLTPDQVTAIAAKITAMEASVTDHPQFAVVLIDKLPEGQSIKEYTNKLFAAWGIGRKDINNGVLFLLARQDRKARIEVGYGIEARISDLRADAILQRTVVPALRRGQEDWFKAVDDTVTAVDTDLARTQEADETSSHASPMLMIIAGLVVGGMLFLILWFAYPSRNRRKQRERDEAERLRNREIEARLERLQRQYETKRPYHSTPEVPPEIYRPSPVRSSPPSPPVRSTKEAAAIIGATAGAAAITAAELERKRREEAARRRNDEDAARRKRNDDDAARRRRDDDSSSSLSSSLSSSSSSSSNTDSGSSGYDGGLSGGGGSDTSF